MVVDKRAKQPILEKPILQSKHAKTSALSQETAEAASSRTPSEV
jgi:hypothetical protein